jgi:hypothetical protein
VHKREGKRSLSRPRRGWEDDIKMDLKDIRVGGRELDSSGSRWGQVSGFCECSNEPSGSLKRG